MFSSTAAAYFHNGTTMPLVKVPASAEYMWLTERLTREHPDSDEGECPRTPWTGSAVDWLWSWASCRWHRLRSQIEEPKPKEEVTIIAEMISALKYESETSLNRKITRVSVAAPWLRYWQDRSAKTHGINEALRLAGLAPFPIEDGEPVYITESQAVMAANGIDLCEPFRSDENGGQDHKELKNQEVYFIRWALTSSWNRLIRNGLLNPDSVIHAAPSTQQCKAPSAFTIVPESTPPQTA
jgi:hypothetical protein